MYCILCSNTYIYHKHQPNVGKYTVRPMHPVGSYILFSAFCSFSNKVILKESWSSFTFASHPRIAEMTSKEPPYIL